MRCTAGRPQLKFYLKTQDEFGRPLSAPTCSTPSAAGFNSACSITLRARIRTVIEEGTAERDPRRTGYA